LGGVPTPVGPTPPTAGWLGSLAIVYFIVCELLRIRWEEGVLSRAFPGEYPAYAQAVPRYMPNPLRTRS
jgi:protein-S-isoprenylcysteine O-methyltransferase Ste14